MKSLKRFTALILALVLALPLICFAPPAQAAASDYIAQSYASHLSVATTKAVGLMDNPISSATAKYTVGIGTMLTVQKLHKNTSGAYFYEVLFYNMTLYVDATACTLVDHLTGDVTIANAQSPASLTYGSGFPIKGDISSTGNDLGTITAALYNFSNVHTAPVLSSSDEASGKSYTLTGSTVDNKLHFNLLSPGVYTYMVTAEAISYYVNSSGVLTTSTQIVTLQSQQCIVTDWTNPNPNTAFGIDISEHNGSINWAAAKNDIDYVILRLGWEYTLDNTFLYNVRQVIANGIPYGVYIYSYAETATEALNEANFVINTLKTYNLEPDLPIWFDFEDPLQVNLSYSLQASIVKTFCTTISNAGYQPGLYTFKWIMSSALTDSYFDTLPIWIAQVDGYSSNGTSTYVGGLWQWQYSWKGVISGINNDVDCNYYYGEFPGNSADSTYLSKCTYYPSNMDATVNTATTMYKYPSTDYTNLGTVAAGSKVHVTGLYKNSYGNYWYQIESNGTIGFVLAENVDAGQTRYDDLSVVDPSMANLALGAGYYLKGFLHSIYNQMTTVNAKVYSGEDTTASPVISSSANPNGKYYRLNYSPVCDNLNFSNLDTGYYTYEISADVKNYYVESGTLKSENENVVLWTKPFTVGSATITPPAETSCSHTIVTQAAVAATCTADGKTQGSYCSKCGIVFAAQVTIPATGHSYTATSDGATCQNYELFHYSCIVCGHSYDVSADALGQWSETKPVGVADSQIESATQYRYADCTSKSWQKASTGTVTYVPTWAAGFDTSSSVYTQYNKASSKVTASETATDKVVIDSDAKVGYLWYHWCSTSVTSSWATKTGTYTTFHTYYGTTSPDNYTCDTSDYSYKTSHSSCSNTNWWFPIDVYQQTYTKYTMAPDGKTWGDWSAWSDTVYTAVDNTRKVESRTVYRYIGAELAPHTWVSGACSACGTACDHDYGIDGVCTICGESDTCKHTSHSTSGICSACGESVGHKYENQTCTVCGKTMAVPTMTPTSVSVSFENEIFMNIYFTISDLDNVDPANIGLITWTSPQSAGTIDTADAVIPGGKTSNSEYMVSTQNIVAKKLGDTIYWKIYVKLDDGSYVYSALRTASPKAYATYVIGTSTNARMRALCVAMLNYGAAAQEYFGHKPYNLMNAGLTDEQKALVQAYDASMVATLPTADSTKAAGFTYNFGFASFSRSVSFDEAFSVNCYYTPKYAVDGKMTLYVWHPETYDSVSRLTKVNANETLTMEGTSEFWAAVENIAAKEIDQVFYLSACYESEGVTYYTGVQTYSLGAYCATVAANNNSPMQHLAAQTAVYGYYAKDYFANL